MWLELSFGAVLAGLAVYGYVLFKRARLYKSLGRKVRTIMAQPSVEDWGLPSPAVLRDDLAVVPAFLPEDLFHRILTEACLSG